MSTLELIKHLSDGGKVLLGINPKQLASIKSIAERKQAANDTTAAWWKILKFIEG